MVIRRRRLYVYGFLMDLQREKVWNKAAGEGDKEKLRETSRGF